jgi:hypothetical protein
MYRLNRIVAVLALAGSLAFVACSGEAKIDTDNDADSAGLNTTPGDTGAAVDVNVDTSGGPDVNLDSTGAAAGDAAQGAANESIEKLVETHLALTPGFSGVDVESEGDAVIVLTGTVASEAEKASAETETKTVAGVKSVRNEITVK